MAFAIALKPVDAAGAQMKLDPRKAELAGSRAQLGGWWCQTHVVGDVSPARSRGQERGAQRGGQPRELSKLHSDDIGSGSFAERAQGRHLASDRGHEIRGVAARHGVQRGLCSVGLSADARAMQHWIARGKLRDTRQEARR